MTSPEAKSAHRIGQEQSVMPVTIKMILDAPEPTGNSVFKINDKEIANVFKNN